MIAFFYMMKDASMIKQFRRDFFSESTIINIFDYVKDFVIDYNVEPTLEQVLELVKLQGKDDIDLDSIRTLWQNKTQVSKYQDDWLHKTIGNWGRFRSFYKGLENTIAYVSQIPTNIDYDECCTYIDKASNIFNNGMTFSVNVTEGHNFFDPVNHVIPLADTHSTGYKFVDLCLNGGFTKKGLYVFMGAPKVGKSMWLCNMAAESIKSGYDTIYITLEMSYQLVSQRIGSNLLSIPIDKYNTIASDVNFMTKAMQNFYSSSFIQPGEFYIEEFPTSSATASDIELFILKKEEELTRIKGKPFKFKNVMIDYINIMKDQRSSSLSDNSYVKIKNICEDVRAMAQRNMWAVVSLTQTNRSGQEATDLNMTNVSESTGLTATVDALFGIIQNNLMRASNVYYLKALALRNSPHMGDKKKFDFDPHYLRLKESNDDIIPDTEDVPEMYRSAAANAMIKQKQQGNYSGQVIQSQTPNIPTGNLVASEVALNLTADALFG